ncbi:54S ribosomal protein L3 mitochondrial, partial [Linderina pennispora]
MFSATSITRRRLAASIGQHFLSSNGAAAISGSVRFLATAKGEGSRQPVMAEAGSTTFAALEARLNLKFKDAGLMEQVCTHKSFENGRLPSNERLEWMGKRVLNLYVGEYLHVKYPNLPTETLQDVQHANFGLTSLAEVAKHFGMKPAMRWMASSKEAPNVGLTK